MNIFISNIPLKIIPGFIEGYVLNEKLCNCYGASSTIVLVANFQQMLIRVVFNENLRTREAVV